MLYPNTLPVGDFLTSGDQPPATYWGTTYHKLYYTV